MIQTAKKSKIMQNKGLRRCKGINIDGQTKTFNPIRHFPGHGMRHFQLDL